jgi:heme/copper-type cytochrome/quinol oxidase subunit 2
VGDQVISPQRLDEMERDCFIVTNSYVYSLFGVVAGIIMIIVWFAKKRKADSSGRRRRRSAT